MGAELGFEPKTQAYETCMLPLHHSAFYVKAKKLFCYLAEQEGIEPSRLKIVLTV